MAYKYLSMDEEDGEKLTESNQEVKKGFMFTTLATQMKDLATKISEVEV